MFILLNAYFRYIMLTVCKRKLCVRSASLWWKLLKMEIL